MVAVVGADTEPPPTAGVYVGTEAVLHRIPRADVVAFLEFDSEMLAPRFRAAEQALALVVRAGRLAPEVLVQTFNPDNDVLRAVAAGDPGLVLPGERARRELLGLPPFGALAALSGSGADEFAAQLARSDTDGIEVGGDGEGRFLVRAGDWMTLGRTLNGAERPSGSRVRVAIDPPRL